MTQHSTKLVVTEPTPQPYFRFVDLFAGLGGFHTALKGLGGEAVFAAEWVEGLRVLYKKNYGILPAGDINSVEVADIPDHDVLTAGFPCQPFSKAGEQLGFEHTEQGHLFFKVAEILAAKKPKFFILENVPNILKHGRGETMRVISRELSQLGYEVEWNRYSPHEFGVPQIRERVYIVGARRGLQHFTWPTPARTSTDIRSVLDEYPAGAKELPVDVVRCLEVWNEFLQASPPHLELPSYPLWSMEFGATYPYEDTTPYALIESGQNLDQYKGSHGAQLKGLNPSAQLASLPSHARRPQEKFPKWKIDFIRQNRQFYSDNKSWIDPWLPKVLSFPSSQQKLEWNAKGEQKNIWDFVLQFRASGVRIKRSRTAPSLVAMTDTQVPIIGWERRYMTPRECSRLQSLGDIILPESRPAAYRALGNAVNADVVQAIARPLLADVLFAGARSLGATAA
ncbi:DNA (cytosine-5-)-methyltransferase [Pseudarthrobacter phenanthrenivorans]|uniref:DNA (cytosine-5-)-methyltransferase n=1 Tax=Pseudarthrobacter phenanthrenivorans TaxID=361575 RepID=UPI000AA9D6B7|nr:DNA (cytosine-5-)-methyltransferase [Pseudarthrobacter phenanthrenivorans]